MRKSKYDLTEFAPVKIPKNMCLEMKAIDGERWSERVRDLCSDYLIRQRLKEEET